MVSAYIVNPVSGAKALRWFSTHPASEERIANLRALALTERQPAMTGASSSAT